MIFSRRKMECFIERNKFSIIVSRWTLEKDSHGMNLWTTVASLLHKIKINAKYQKNSIKSVYGVSCKHIIIP